MIRFLKEIYLTAFVIINKCPTRRGNEYGRIGGAIGVVTLIEWLNIMNISSWIDIFAGKQIVPRLSESEVWLTGLVLFFINVYVLFILRHGIKFEREFDHLKKSRKIALVTSCVVLLLATIVFTIYSTSDYRRFFYHV
jgi:hypothetical protein